MVDTYNMRTAIVRAETLVVTCARRFIVHAVIVITATVHAQNVASTAQYGMAFSVRLIAITTTYSEHLTSYGDTFK